MIVAVITVGSGLLLASADARDGWADVEKAAKLVELVDGGGGGGAASPALARVRAQKRGLELLFDAEVTESLSAARSVEPAMNALDAASVKPLCTQRRTAKANVANVVLLAEHALATAIVDGILDAREGRSSARTVAGVGRALSLAMIAERCLPAYEGLSRALDIHTRARFVTWHLAEQRMINAADLQALVDQMNASANGQSMERLVLVERHGIEQIGKRVDDAAKEKAALAAAVKSFDAIERPAPFDPFAVKLECTKHVTEMRVSRAVERALQLKAAELISADSQITPLLDGRGYEVARAGPFAKSCGFEDGDVIVEVNGVLTSRADALTAVPAVVQRDSRANVSVLRAGERKQWTITVAR